MRSERQIKMEKAIMKRLSGKALAAAEFLFSNPEIQALQDYANIVSIKRLGYNDHGPVHMRTSALNAIIMFDLLVEAGIQLNLEKEELGTAEDSKVAVLTAAVLHDIGMSVSRDKHEFMGIHLAIPFVEQILTLLYHADMMKKVILKSLIIECIFGHMATQTIHTLEAGLVLIGDGCDMERGRSRISTLLSNHARVGDIHKYSATGIKKVTIAKGDNKPIRIRVDMTESVGFFQVEEVLYPKISSSPVGKYIELEAGVIGKGYQKYI